MLLLLLLPPPMLAGWGCRDLPEELQPSNLRQTRQRDDSKQFVGVFGRLLWGGQFSTILTNLQLNSDTTSCVLHPEADRPLTCREAARVQVRCACLPEMSLLPLPAC